MTLNRLFSEGRKLSWWLTLRRSGDWGLGAEDDSFSGPFCHPGWVCCCCCFLPYGRSLRMVTQTKPSWQWDSVSTWALTITHMTRLLIGFSSPRGEVSVSIQFLCPMIVSSPFSGFHMRFQPQSVNVSMRGSSFWGLGYPCCKPN